MFIVVRGRTSTDVLNADGVVALSGTTDEVGMPMGDKQAHRTNLETILVQTERKAFGNRSLGKDNREQENTLRWKRKSHSKYSIFENTFSL